MIQEIIDVINDREGEKDIFSINAMLKRVDAYLKGPYFPSYHQLIVCFLNKLIKVYGDELQIGNQLFYFLIINRDFEVLKLLNDSTFYGTIACFDYIDFSTKEIPVFLLLLKHGGMDILENMFRKHKHLTKKTINIILPYITDENIQIFKFLDYSNYDTIMGCLDKKRKNYSLILDNLHNIGKTPVIEKVKIVYAFPNHNNASQSYH